MSSPIEQALFHARAVRAWDDLNFARAFEIADGLEVSASGKLISFTVATGTYPNGAEFRNLAPREGVLVPPELLYCANELWRKIGNDNTEGENSLARIAQKEFVRCQLSDIVGRIVAHKLQFPASTNGDIDEAIVQRALNEDWANAESILRDPFPTFWHGEDPATALYNRLSTISVFDRVSAENSTKMPSTVGEILGGLALSLLDRAAATVDLDHRSKLIVHALLAVQHFEFDIGWQAHETMLRDNAAMHGKAGAAARLAPIAQLKKWATEEAAKMQGPDMWIARTLARRVPVEMQKISADPARLIYDTIRASRKRQGGSA